MELKMAKAYKVAQKGFNSNNLLNINALIERKEENPNILFDVIYMEFYEGKKVNNAYSGYDKTNKINVKFNSYELRIFCYALKSLVASEKSDYKKYSNPALASSNDGVKEITFGFSNSKYWINVEEINKKKFGIGFTLFELKALIDSLVVIANEVDEVLYQYQRAIDKKINAERKF